MLGDVKMLDRAGRWGGDGPDIATALMVLIRSTFSNPDVEGNC